MNVVFDKRTLRVVSLFDTDVNRSDQEILQAMFPNEFKNLSLWNIKCSVSHSPVSLSIKFDKDHNPAFLMYKGKVIYTATAEDKAKIQLKTEKEKEAILSQVLPRTLRSSIGTDIIKMWKHSPYTKSDVVQSLNNFKYFLDEKIIPVSWWGTFVDAGGYGNMNRSIVFRLHNYRVIAKAEICPSLPQISATGQYYVSKQTSFNFRRLKNYPRIYGFGPQPHAKHPGRTVFFTMMETETLHPSFRDLCNQYSDEVWVPSSHNKRVFEAGGIKKPIFLMPLGIDEVIYGNADTAVPRDLKKTVVCDILGKPVSQGINSFRFFTLFGWSYRKGIDILLKSFIKAFTAKDDVALVIFSNHVGPNVVLRDAQKYAPMVRRSDYPQILFIPGVTPELEMPSLYKVGNAFVSTSRGEGFCTLPSAQIKTPNGIVQIKDIAVGDTVFSHMGVSRKVIETFSREYSGEMVKIKCYGRSNQCLNLTPNHKVRALRVNVSHHAKAKLFDNMSYDIVADKLNIASIGHHLIKYDQHQLEWIPSGEIKKGDYIFYPLLNYNTNMNDWVQNDIIYLDKIPLFQEKFIIENGKIFKIGRNQYINRFKGRCLFDKTNITITNDFLKIAGYFVAEGCYSRNSVIFSFHKKEKVYHEEVVRLMKNIFGDITCKIGHHKTKNSTRVVFQSIIASRLFSFMFGHGARNKKLPSFLFLLSKEQRYCFLHGFFNGDGYYSKVEKISASTASVDLANNIFDLLFSLGIKSSIKSRMTDGKLYYSLQISNTRDCNRFLNGIGEHEYIRNDRRHSECFRSYDNFQLLLVSDVVKFHYSGQVCNIGVEKDNSYICENIAVHNCLPPIEAAACGLPVISCNNTGMSEYLRDDNSFMITTREQEVCSPEMHWISGYYHGQLFPKLGEDQINQAVKHMHFVVNNYQIALEKGKKLKEEVWKKYTWDKTAERVSYRIKEIS